MSRPGGGVVELRGPDALDYAQGQLSADVASLAVGESTLSLVLEPTGKMNAVVRVRRTGTDALDLEVDPAAVQAVTERMRRFLLRTDATVEPGEVDAGQVLEPTAEVERIRAGWPAAGHEYAGPYSGEVIPAELGRWLIEEAVSFTKGCYVGQELVARVHHRGDNVPRRLRVIELPEEATAEPGDTIVLADDEAVQGYVTSAATDPATGRTVVLGFVHRRVDDDRAADLRVHLSGGG